ncbi:hypothetical protein D9M72_543150 [compost metagenome]
MAHRLDHRVNRVRGAIAHVGKRIAFEHVEDFTDDHATGRRRRRGDDVIAAIIALDRLQFAHRIALEVRLGEHAALLRARLDDLIGDRALVEGVRAFFGNARKRCGKVRLDEFFAGRKGLAVGLQEDRGRGRIFRQPFGPALEGTDIALLQHEAILG